jgi:hypothetical protein
MRRGLLCALLMGGVLPGLFGEDGKRVVPLYTNEDLDRVSPFKGQTGAASVNTNVASRPPVEEPHRDRNEAYWRREASRVREQARRLEEQAATLRARNTATGRSRGRKTRASAPNPDWEARAASLRARAERLTADLEDRARHEGVPPGWLR